MHMHMTCTCYITCTCNMHMCMCMCMCMCMHVKLQVSICLPTLTPDATRVTLGSDRASKELTQATWPSAHACAAPRTSFPPAASSHPPQFRPAAWLLRLGLAVTTTASSATGLKASLSGPSGAWMARPSSIEQAAQMLEAHAAYVRGLSKDGWYACGTCDQDYFHLCRDFK